MSRSHLVVTDLEVDPESRYWYSQPSVLPDGNKSCALTTTIERGPQGCHMQILTTIVAAAANMAFHNSLTGRLEELRYPSLRSPEADASFTNGAATSRPESLYFSTMSSSNDTRTNLQRRFTTDSTKMSLAKPFGAQYGGMNSHSVSPNSRPRKIVRSFLHQLE